jgi:hypothetical protein
MDTLGSQPWPWKLQRVEKNLVPLTDSICTGNAGEDVRAWVKTADQLLEGMEVHMDSHGSYRLISASRIPASQQFYQLWDVYRRSVTTPTWNCLRKWLLTNYGPCAVRGVTDLKRELLSLQMQEDTLGEYQRVITRIVELNDNLPYPETERNLCAYLMKALHHELYRSLESVQLPTDSLASLSAAVAERQRVREERRLEVGPGSRGPITTAPRTGTQSVTMVPVTVSSTRPPMPTATSTPFPTTTTTGAMARSQGAAASDMTCFECNQVGHIQRNCPQRPARPCYKCNQVGHFAARCPAAAHTVAMRPAQLGQGRRVAMGPPMGGYGRGQRQVMVTSTLTAPDGDDGTPALHGGRPVLMITNGQQQQEPVDEVGEGRASHAMEAALPL